MLDVVVVVAQPVRFDENDPRPMLRHLDGWARRALRSPEGWGSTSELCGQWADYSPRNQVLLASYGIAGPVAGTATWERVPSSEPGRGCAVRTGEHGLPVRVPVVDGGGDVGSDRSRSGARSASVAGGHRWEYVFALEQLARRPAPDALDPTRVPQLTPGEWVEAARVASGRVLGRVPRKIDGVETQLAVLAGRVHHGPGRVRLSDDFAAQAGWLAADRIGLTTSPMPAFDPSGLSGRERWRTMVDVRHAVDRVIAGLSHAVGVDLAASPLPRHELVDDRLVPADRRNYLAPADLRALPLGLWIEAGPYTKSEWLARGIAGAAGTAAFLRVNDRSYLAVYEARHGAMWRLETTGSGTHQGLVSTAIAEALLRDVEANDRGYRFLSKRVWGGRELSRIETAAELQLVSLRTGQDLGAIGADTWLTTSDPDDYPQTRAWGQWLRRTCPSAAGFAWLSKREPGTTSYVVFGDRCPPGAFRLSPPPIRGACVFDDQDGFDWLRSHLAAYRVSVRR